MESAPRKVLIADDEQDILEIVRYNLEAEGYQVISAKDGDEALEKIKLFKPDLAILDIMMPKRTGLQVCEIIRSQSALKDTLVLFLTALNDESSHIKGFDTGADDYVGKPISPRVLMSRVNALFRRMGAKENDKEVIRLGNMVIDPVRYLVICDGREVTLAKKEFELLHLLAARQGRVFLRNEILSQVWGNEVIVGDRTIDVHIRKIRQKLGVDCIRTIKGVGYKFEL